MSLERGPSFAEDAIGSEEPVACQDHLERGGTISEAAIKSTDTSECLVVCGDRQSHNDTGGISCLSIRTDNDGEPLCTGVTQEGTGVTQERTEVIQERSEVTQDSHRPSDGWDAFSTSSGYGESDAFINCGHDDFPFCRCLSDRVGGASSTFHCEHDDFPFCDCLSQAATARHPRPSFRQGSQRGERRRRRGYIGPSLSAFREAALEVLSETDTDTEGAVGYTGSVPKDPSPPPPSTGLLSPPATPTVRRASIVTCDSRTASMQPTPEPVKLAVFGSDGVGKSALIVRLLTGRFIGEYDPTMEAVYSYQFPLPGHDLPLQVMDTAGQVEVVEEGRERQVAWGDGFLLVFSLVSHPSFVALSRLRRVILELTPGPPRPMVLVGNKADLSHAREVHDDEIRDLADCWGCDYFEVAAPEPWDVVVRPFTALYQAVLESRDSR